MAEGSSLPDQIVEAIALSNAKSIGEQPAILSNLALANQILNNNMQQQLMISQQQAINQMTMATVAKAVALITSPVPPGGGGGGGKPGDSTDTILEAIKQLGQLFEKATKPPEPQP